MKTVQTTIDIYAREYGGLRRFDGGFASEREAHKSAKNCGLHPARYQLFKVTTIKEPVSAALPSNAGIEAPL